MQIRNSNRNPCFLVCRLVCSRSPIVFLSSSTECCCLEVGFRGSKPYLLDVVYFIQNSLPLSHSLHVSQSNIFFWNANNKHLRNDSCYANILCRDSVVRNYIELVILSSMLMSETVKMKTPAYIWTPKFVYLFY